MKKVKELKTGDAFITNCGTFLGIVNGKTDTFGNLSGWLVLHYNEGGINWKVSKSMISPTALVTPHILITEHIKTLPEDALVLYTSSLASVAPVTSSTQTSICTCKSLWVGVDNDCPYHNRNK